MAGFPVAVLAYDARTTTAELKKLDTGAIDLILKKDLAGFSGYCDKTGITICGRNPIRMALALPVEGFEAKLAGYDTSGAMTGDYSRSVSYAAIMFSGKLRGSRAQAGDQEELTREDRAYLLQKARTTSPRGWTGEGGYRSPPPMRR